MIPMSGGSENRGSKLGQNKSVVKTGLKGDYGNVLLLILLYFLQGIPLGVMEAIPLILVNKGVSYDEQAIFSFALWPYSLKLLWAPFVDTFYVRRFGRRKSWFVPMQYGMGLFMVLLSFEIGHLMGNNGETSPHVPLLTLCFLALTFLTASQDIAVDGWALTMLQRHNVEYSTTCNSVGVTLGALMGSTAFLALESPDFCNRWLRKYPQPVGILSLSNYLFFWGIVFIIITTIVMLFKRESEEVLEEGKAKIGLVDTYKMLWKILRLRSVQWLVFVLLTYRIGFMPSDVVAPLKIVENGVKREHLGLLKIPLIPLKIILPCLVTRVSKKKPLKALLCTYPLRLFMSLILSLLVWYTAVSRLSDGSFSVLFYTILSTGLAFQLLSTYCTQMSTWAFMASISDPLIGGTYMTLLTTLSNLGTLWIQTLSLYAVKPLTFDYCPHNGLICSSMNNQTIASKFDVGRTQVNGYYTETVICIIVGLFWMICMRKKLRWLESIPKVKWHCS